MADRETVRELAAQMLVDRRKAVSDAAADELGPAPGSNEATSAREREIYWKPAITREAEVKLWMDAIPHVRQGDDSALEHLAFEIAGKVFPWRMKIAPLGGRTESDDVAAWAARHKRLGPPDGWNRDQIGPPPEQMLGETPAASTPIASNEPGYAG